ncbi:hypothetical protein RJ640_005491 [Escallonia rubra]|uniref:non-specific serine/threonine protein kinase n=1 Tax=Escallonia rubra TaxID=112253 RepID=A0AA88RJH7_9ASTE|nr:hypothetical protein RJ640_005491 [Escallonia rubra]
MGSGRWVLVLFHIFIHVFTVGLTIAQPDFPGYLCLDTGNYTQDSAYHKNLDDLFITLSTKTTSFSKFSSGQTPDVAKAIALCRGDVDPDTCRRCVDDSTRRLRQLCPNQKEAMSHGPSLKKDSFGDVGRKNATWIVPVTVSMLTAAVVAILGLFFYRRRSRNQKQKALCSMDSLEGYNLQVDQDDSGEMRYFMLTTIRAATNGFSIENKLGEGGFGPVYRGKLDDGKEIAVKRLSKNSGQGLGEFKTEVRIIVKLQHKNLVRLLGCCIEGDEKLLVYEYMANTSLDAFLFEPIKCRELDWPKRANIVDGIAKGLRYLHEDSRLKTIHRDMKASNGLFSTKSDVYSFGVMMLEIISGQRSRGFCHAEHDENLLSYVGMSSMERRRRAAVDRSKFSGKLSSDRGFEMDQHRIVVCSGKTYR